MPCTAQVDRDLLSTLWTKFSADILLEDSAVNATGVTTSKSETSRIFRPSRMQKRMASWSDISRLTAAFLISFKRESDMRIGMGLDAINERTR